MDQNNFQRGTKQLLKGNLEKALSYFKKQLAEFACKEVYLNMGNTYRLMNMDAKALDCYLAAADELTPFGNLSFGQYPLADTNIGLISYALGDDDTAISYYQKALEVNPLHFDAIWNYANALLRKHYNGESVNISAAWKMYEYRFKRSNPTPLYTKIPRWDGFSTGKSIIVLSEQGMGDKLMFGRYVSLLKEYFEEVWVQIAPELEVFFSEYKTCTDPSLSNAEVSIPFCSLAARFGDIPGDWLKDKFLDYEKTNGIGIVYSGSTTHSNDRNRSTDARYFTEFSKFAPLYHLNPAAVTPRGMVKADTSSWEKTAKLVRGLDLVISVDTSIVHLCGALGVECWMLQPLKETDFRWGKEAMGSSNMWYDSVRIFRNPGSWKHVFDNVKLELEKRYAKNIP